MSGMGKTAEHAAKEWNYKASLVSLVFAILLQAVFLPCLCYAGVVKMNIAVAVDLLVVLRLVVARSRRERGRGWLFYAALPYAMIPIIEILASFVAPH